MNWKEHLLRTLARLGLWRPGNLHYIGGSDVLPAPLSREEERACIPPGRGGPRGVRNAHRAQSAPGRLHRPAV